MSESSEQIDLHIKDLKLNGRAFNILTFHGIDTVAQLIEHTELELINLRNMGRLAMASIKQRLAERGLKLKEPSTAAEIAYSEVTGGNIDSIKRMVAVDEQRIIAGLNRAADTMQDFIDTLKRDINNDRVSPAEKVRRAHHALPWAVANTSSDLSIAFKALIEMMELQARLAAEESQKASE